MNIYFLFKNFKSSWYNFFRPKEVLIFFSFPLTGYLLVYKKMLPLDLIFSMLFIILGIIIDNTIEGYKRNKEDPLYGDYPLFITPIRFLILKILRIIFYSFGVIFVFIFSRSSFSWIIILVFLSILYNNHKVSVQKYAPFDSLLHFLGGIFFTISGGVWEGGEFLRVLPFGISLGLIFTGGYFNHISLDKERDEKMGKFTLAHKISFKKIRIISLIFIVTGDILMGYFLFFRSIIFALFFICGALIVIFFGLKLKDPKKYRTAYRLIHFILGLFILIFILFF